MKRSFVAVVACLFLAIFPSCSTAGREPTKLAPCVDPKPAQARELCPGLTAEQCRSRLDFARRITRGTVSLFVTTYEEDRGAEYFGGTGAIIDAQGTVLTAEHVVHNTYAIVATPREITADQQPVRHQGIPMRILAMDKTIDAALLVPTFKNELPAPLPWTAEPLAPGDAVWQFGKTTLWSWGTVKDTAVSYAGIDNTVRTTCYVDHGDSGGPLIDNQGRVRGLLTRMDPDHNGYFVPLGFALRTLGYPK